MLKRFLIISSFFLILIAYSGNEAYGQLITDSDKRLKTQKSDKKGWLYNLFHQDKGKSSSRGALQRRKRGTSPRYSSGSPFAAFNKRKSTTPRSVTSKRRDLFKKQRYTSPRYSSSGLAGLLSGKKKPIRTSGSRPPFTKKDKRVSPRTSSGKPFQQSLFAQFFNRDRGPRYSSGSPFTKKQLSVAPRYSAGSPFSRKQKSVTPRYSAGTPFEQNFLSQLFNRNSGPRSESGSPFSKKQLSVNPRYSAGSPFTSKDKKVAPRYSQRSSEGDTFLERLFSPKSQVRYSAGSPFTRKQLSVTPRYSAGSPFTRKDKNITPRYSQGSPYELNLFEKIFHSKPDVRYSAGSPFTRKQKSVTPRYSVGSPEYQSVLDRLLNKKTQPRYSQGSPYASMKWNWIKPRYSTNKHRFDGNDRQKEANRPYNFYSSKYKGTDKGRSKVGFTINNLWTSNQQKRYEGNEVPRFDPKQSPSANFSGNFKRKWISEKDMHPSFRSNKVNSDSELIRKSMRKWNIFWTRFNWNKAQPDAVTDKISKPKFDRKEAEIWNN